MSGHQVAKDEAFLLFRQPGQAQLVGYLLAARLDRKIGLTQGHNGFSGIGVLNDEVAGVSREVVVLPWFTCCTCFDDFVDFNEIA